MDRELERRFVVGQVVAYNDAGTLRHGMVERILDTQVPALVTVRLLKDCAGCRVTRPETAFQPVHQAANQKQQMIPPRGAITKARR